MRPCPVIVPALVIVASAVGAGPASAQESINSPLTRVSFAGYAGDGLVPSPGIGQVDSDNFRVTGMSVDSTFGGTFVDGDFAEGASPGGVSGDGTGGLWAFSTSPGDPAFGFQQSGDDFTPGEIFLRFVNATSTALTDPTIRFEIWVFNDASRASEIEFAWSEDGNAFDTIDALAFTSDESPDAAPAWELHPRSIMLSGVTIAPGGQLHLRWTADYVSGTGGYDELALDDIEVEVPDPDPDPEPEPEPDPDPDPDPAADDEDGDGVPDADDNCPTYPNPGQADQDADGAGNACDELGDDDGGYAAGCTAGGGAGGSAALALLLLAALRHRTRRVYRR